MSDTNFSDSEARRPPPPVDWSGVRRVHVMGICGSAMGAFAGMLRASGYEVRGSDRGAYPPMSTTLAAMGVHIYEGYAASNLAWAPDVVVVGNVVRPDFPEAVAVREQKIPYCSLPQALAALYIRGRHSVVVTGTHGKTTTSSMTAWLLHEAGLDPGFMIGGVTANFQSNHRVGGDRVFVVEGDEYDTAYFDKGQKFLHYLPRTASVNNIEMDHADIFADVEAIEAAFTRFVRLLPPDGRLVVPVDDARARRVAESCPAPVWTVGLEAASGADVRAESIRTDGDGVAFSLILPGESARPTRLSLWGDHNLRNALVASALAFTAGAPADAIAAALPGFRLPKKRQELRGVALDVPVIDDFAHHPTAIRETIRSVRMRYPTRRILALFEVESNTSRRRIFQDGFAEALAGADLVWFCRPLDKDDALPLAERLDMDGLVASIRSAGTPTELIADTELLARSVVAAARPGGDVILAMSGRDFHGIHGRLLDLLRERAETE
jgi:UDP-N-acetylmuramate: L-alanyl-gamma-D-glutamyl-meso-diaminopimelate ligase